MIQKIIHFIYFILIICGLYVSYRFVLQTRVLESDSAFPAALFYDVITNGLSSLSKWTYTQDNWILSLIPLQFLIFKLFGVTPKVIFTSGWLIFVFSAIVSGMIANSLGAKRSAWLIVIVLLFLGSYAHDVAFISHPVSHNISNLFGLISILLLIKWLKNGNYFIMLLLMLGLFCAAVSDPWLNISYMLPILFLGLKLFDIPMDCLNKSKKKIFFISLFFTVCAIKSRFFGLLSFLPSINAHLVNFSQFKTNVFYLLFDFGKLVNLLFFDNFISAVLSLAIFGGSLVYLIRAFFCYQHYCSGILIKIFSIVVISSTSITILAFTLTGKQFDFSARFLINVLYLNIILFGILLELSWGKLSNKIRFIISGIIILFITSNVISLYTSNTSPRSDAEITAEFTFLKQHNLSLGYGSYWSSGVYPILIKSDNTIKILPVLFDERTGFLTSGRAQTKTSWFGKTTQLIKPQRFFIYFKSDAETCPNMDICIKGAVIQFGVPDEVLSFNNVLIYVWNKQLPNLLQDTEIQHVKVYRYLNIIISILFSLLMGLLIYYFLHAQAIRNSLKKLNIRRIYLNNFFIKSLYCSVVISILISVLFVLVISYVKLDIKSQGINSSLFYSLEYTPLPNLLSNSSLDNMRKQKYLITKIDIVSGNKLMYSLPVSKRTTLFDIVSSQKVKIINLRTINQVSHNFTYYKNKIILFLGLVALLFLILQLGVCFLLVFLKLLFYFI